VKKWTAIIHQSEPLLTKIFNQDSAYLLFHDDADGCCAAAILINLMHQHASHDFIGVTSPEKHSVDLTPKLVDRLRTAKPKFIIAMDLAFTQSVATIKKLLSQLNAHMLIYDHHIQSQALDWPTRCIHINPFTFNLGNIPASHYSYILHKHHTHSTTTSWIAAVGVVADYRTNECTDLLTEVRQHYPTLYPFKTIDQTTAIHSPLMQLAHLINAGYQHSDQLGAKLAIAALDEAVTNPHMLLEGTSEKANRLHQFRHEVDAELERYLQQFNSQAEFLLNTQLAFFTINPKFNIASQIATQLQHTHPHTIIAIISPETQGKLKISLRRGTNQKVNLATLAATTTANLDHASGGGHQEAAGCVIQKQDLDTWKKNTITHLEKLLP
jgi:single-stranded DNA-specific DHH superfamily exonuclease